MKLYRAVFRVSSVLTEIPKAQTIFGAVCTIMANTKGEKMLEEYFRSFETEPFFIFSDMMPENLFPAPKQNLFPLNLVDSVIKNSLPEEKLNVLKNFKKYKKLRYISRGIFDTYILPDRIEDLKKDILSNQKIEVDAQGILKLQGETANLNMAAVLQTKNAEKQDTTEKELYYMNQIYSGKDQRFVIYVKSNRHADIIKEIFSLFQYTGLGHKRSTGCNSFVLESMEPVMAYGNSQLQYLLSDCIPDGDINYEKSSYQIQSNLYRASKFYNGGHYTGRFSSLSAGSTISPFDYKEYYGKLETSISNGKLVYHYGIGMVI